MNDDPPTSSTDLPPSLDNPLPDVGGTVESEGGSSDFGREHQQRARNRIRSKKRLEIIGDLLRNLDIMIYCELSALYYLDCSTFRFLLRAMVQFYYLTPKPPLFPETPKSRPYAGSILATNILCIFLHIVYARPEAGEAMRGYLHGGLMIDFVGQKGPVSKFWLLVLDLLTLTMQLFMLAAHIEQQNAKVMSDSGSASVSVPTQDGTATSTQNFDSEERGVLRSEPSDTADIELRTLVLEHGEDRAHAGLEDAENEEREAMLDEPPAFDSEDPRDHPLDIFHSGEIIAIDLYLFETIRKQYSTFGTRGTDDSNSSSVNPSTALARDFLHGRLNMRAGVGGSGLGRS